MANSAPDVLTEEFEKNIKLLDRYWRLGDLSKSIIMEIVEKKGRKNMGLGIYWPNGLGDDFHPLRFYDETNNKDISYEKAAGVFISKYFKGCIEECNTGVQSFRELTSLIKEILGEYERRMAEYLKSHQEDIDYIHSMAAIAVLDRGA